MMPRLEQKNLKNLLSKLKKLLKQRENCKKRLKKNTTKLLLCKKIWKVNQNKNKSITKPNLRKLKMILRLKLSNSRLIRKPT
jgi:hypothetical protein